jgi:ATP-dependent exoDNAse (exonuclease V) beta subunit
MEWSHVTVASDFVMRFYYFDKKTGELLQKKFVPEDEVNLLYVAVTRAMDTVSLPLELEELLGI